MSVGRFWPAALIVLTACGGSRSDPVGNRPATPLPATYYVSEYGIRVGVEVGFRQTREITAARLVWDHQADEIALYPVDGTDPDVAPDSITVPPGRRALLEGSMMPPCTQVPSLPEFEVVSTHRGVEHTERFVPDDQDDFERAFAQWCDRSVSMSVQGSSSTPEGDYELRVEFTNPGTTPVEVVSEQVDSGTSTWQAASVTVPPGSRASLTIVGHGPPECAAVPPWETGHVLADGKVIKPPADDGWC